jgi:hypothetical protein
MKRLLPVLVLLLLHTAHASPVTRVASANATVRTSGPTTSPWFHNAQAVTGGGFESFAVSTYLYTAADFGLPAVTDLTSVQVSYMQSNAAFTNDGPLDFFVSFDPAVAGGDFSGLAHTGIGAGIDDTQFSDSPSLQSIGTGTFTTVATGHVDTYALSFGGATKTSLLNAINSGSPFAILMSAATGSAAATHAGLESTRYVINGGSEPDIKRTSLSIEAIPEANTVWLLLLGAAALRWTRARRKL